MNLRYYLAREGRVECVEGEAPRITHSRAKSALLSLRNIVIHHEN